jgi:hypothetical protein
MGYLVMNVNCKSHVSHNLFQNVHNLALPFSMIYLNMSRPKWSRSDSYQPGRKPNITIVMSIVICHNKTV